MRVTGRDVAQTPVASLTSLLLVVVVVVFDDKEDDDEVRDEDKDGVVVVLLDIYMEAAEVSMKQFKGNLTNI